MPYLWRNNFLSSLIFLFTAAFLLIIGGCTNIEPAPVPAGQTLKVSFIDVGQADSILIQIASGKNILIDAGNNGDADTVISYIKGQNVSRLDYVIATHPHEDHIGAMDNVIKTFDIGQFIMPKQDHTSQTYRDMIDALRIKGLKITEAKAGLNLDLGPGANALLAAPITGNYESLNNCSAVLKLTYGAHTFLFTGDAEELSEEEMLSSGVDLKADVLKVGHHGSGTSTSKAFLDKVRPAYAVISVGKSNSYGHPNQAVLDRLGNLKTAVFRTDQMGTITAESDGTSLKVHSNSNESVAPSKASLLTK